MQKLGLTDVLNWLQAIGGASWLVVALVVLVLGLFAGLVLAAITILAGLAYNFLASATGGVVVNAAVVGEQPTRGSGRAAGPQTPGVGSPSEAPGARPPVSHTPRVFWYGLPSGV